jgi:hypothetical protein
VTWGAAAILVGGLLAIGGVAAWLIHRASKRAEDAETAAAVARAKALDVQSREARARHEERFNRMSPDKVLKETHELAERIRRDKERRQ